MYAAASKSIIPSSSVVVVRVINTAQSAAKPSKTFRLETRAHESYNPPEETPVVGSSESTRNSYFGQYGTWRAQNLEKGSSR